MLLSAPPTVRLFSVLALKALNVYLTVPLQFDTVADCVEISNVILKSYTVYTEVWDVRFSRVASPRMSALLVCACFVCMCACSTLVGLSWCVKVRHVVRSTAVLNKVFAFSATKMKIK